jgi:regulator of CtrA degradation
MPAESACDERYRLSGEGAAAAHTASDDLPGGLLSLLDRSERLYERVRHLDRRMYVEDAETDVPNPVASQLDRLRSAFGG